ncbi:MAG: hypothetical protein ACRDM1_00780 [Gaiellaceae bacterium]
MTLNRRFMGAAGVTALLIAIVALFATIGSAASGNASTAQYAPQNTGTPTISGTAQEGSTLTTSNGDWTSSSKIAYTYQWQRCDAKGANCGFVSGATKNTYTAQSDDIGKTLRAVVAASNADGATHANSLQTAVVTAKVPAGPAGQVKLPNGKTSVPVASLSLPYRLVVDDLKFTPPTIASRQPVQMQVHVSEASTGFVVRDALVYVTAIPFARIQQPAEVQTNQEGWATITLQPTARLPLKKGYLLTMFVRARKAGDSVLAGVSTRRLVSLRIS